MNKKRPANVSFRFLLLFVLIITTLFSAVPAMALSTGEDGSETAFQSPPDVSVSSPPSEETPVPVPEPSSEPAPEIVPPAEPEVSPETVPPAEPETSPEPTPEAETEPDSAPLPHFTGISNADVQENTEFNLLENISAFHSDGSQMQVSVSNVVCETDSSYVYDGSNTLLIGSAGNVYRIEYTAVHTDSGEMYTAFRQITSISAQNSQESGSDSEADADESVFDPDKTFTLADLSRMGYSVEMDTAEISTDNFVLECVHDKQGEVPHDVLSFGDVTTIKGGELKNNVPRIVNNSHGHMHSYIRAHVKDVQVYYTGILHIIDGANTKDYIYYTTDSRINDKSVYAVLKENEKITLSYSHDVDYLINYEFKTADGTVTQEGPEGQSLDDIFSPDRAITAKNGQHVSVKINLPRGYKAKITAVTKEGAVLHEAAIGEMISYRHPSDNVNNIVHTDGSPTEIILEHKFDIADMANDIIITLQYEKIDTFTFNAKLWTDTVFSKNRIQINRSEAPSEQNCILKSTDNSFVWEFDGITALSGRFWNTWEMDQLEINGEPVGVPITTLASTEPLTKTTELSTGTVVKLTVASQGGKNAVDGRRRYTLEITNCYEDLTISGGNMVSHHHKEYAMSILNGVRNPGYFAPGDWYNSPSENTETPVWQTLEQDTLISQKGYKGSSWEHPFRFQRQYGFYTADISFTSKTGEPLQINGDIITPTSDGRPYIEYLIRTDSSDDITVKGTYRVVSFEDWVASDDGYFYFRGTNNVEKFANSQDANGVVLININADPIKLALDYKSGSDASGKTAPVAENIVSLPAKQLGGQKGYNVETNNRMLISNLVPMDTSNKFVFDHWEVMTVNVDSEHEFGYVTDTPKLDETGKPIEVYQGENYVIDVNILPLLHDCFYFVGTPKAENSRAVLTLRAVWRERGNTPAITYAVRYILAEVKDGQIAESSEQLIKENSHTVNAGAMLITDLYADADKNLSQNIMNILSGRNDFQKDYTENGLCKWVVYEPKTTKIIESVSATDNTATVYLIRGNSLISAEKIWSSPQHAESLVNVALQRRIDDNSLWETVERAELSAANQWKHTFDALTYYDLNALKQYRYRVVEVDGNNAVIENGAAADLNGNNYIVNYNFNAEKNTWEISNTRLLDLNVSKTVDGSFGDRTKPFTFDISVTQSNGSPLNGDFDYTGSVKFGYDKQAVSPGNGKLSFTDGAAQFVLSHGQQITIKNLPVNCKIKVTEKAADGYSISYTVNGAPEASAELTLQSNSSIDVVNRMSEVPDTGINSSLAGIAVLISVGAVGIISLEFIHIRKRRRSK